MRQKRKGRRGRAAGARRGRGEDDGRGEREIVLWNRKKRRRNAVERVGLRVEGGVLRVTEPREGGRREKKRRREGRDHAVGEREREIWTCVREKQKKRKEGEETRWGHVARREWLRVDNKILPANWVMPRGKGRFFLF
jgi:hypothetical protein